MKCDPLGLGVHGDPYGKHGSEFDHGVHPDILLPYLSGSQECILLVAYGVALTLVARIAAIFDILHVCLPWSLLLRQSLFLFMP